jgi:hypothetical protein
LPPANGFWSLTMCDAEWFFVPNSGERQRVELAIGPLGALHLVHALVLAHRAAQDFTLEPNLETPIDSTHGGLSVPDWSAEPSGTAALAAAVVD